MGASSTTATTDILALAKIEQAEFNRKVEEALTAKKEAEQQEEVYRINLVEALRGKVILFTGLLHAEDRFGQDGMELYPSHSYLSERRLVVTNVFMREERFQPKSPIVYATHEEAHLRHQRGGNVSFMLLRAARVEVVE